MEAQSWKQRCLEYGVAAEYFVIEIVSLQELGFLHKFCDYLFTARFPFLSILLGIVKILVTGNAKHTAVL